MRIAPDGTVTYGLPMFLPLEEAYRQPVLREYLADQYGGDTPIPATQDAETLKAK